MEEQKSEKLITRDEVMTILKCSNVTMWKFTKQRRIPFYRVGRRLLFKESEVLKAALVQNEPIHSN